jgi:hypothetical protein
VRERETKTLKSERDRQTVPWAQAVQCVSRRSTDAEGVATAAGH